MLVRWYFIALKGVTTGPPVVVNNALQDDTCFGISVRINLLFMLFVNITNRKCVSLLLLWILSIM